mgnify:CR=1 FL=1
MTLRELLFFNLGFGGTYEEGFRLWIDSDIREGSYVRSEDGTYERGPLVPGYVKKLNVINRKLTAKC